MKYILFLVVITLFVSFSAVSAATDRYWDCKRLVDKKQWSGAITQCDQSVTALQIPSIPKGWAIWVLRSKLKYADILWLQYRANQWLKIPRSWTGFASGFILPVWYLSGGKLTKLLEQQYLIYYDVYSTSPLEFPWLYDQSLTIKTQFKKPPVDFNQDTILHQYVAKIHTQWSIMDKCDSWAVVLLEKAQWIYQYFANKGRSVDDSNPYYDMLSEIRLRKNELLNCKEPYVKPVPTVKPVPKLVIIKPTVKTEPVSLDVKPKIVNLDVKEH